MILVKQKINGYRLSVCFTSSTEHITQTRICLHFPLMFEPFLIPSPISPSHPLSPPPRPTHSLARCRQVSGSVFSLPRWVLPALVTSSFSPLAYPRLLTSPPPHPTSIWLAAWPELTVPLINTSVHRGITMTGVMGRLHCAIMHVCVWVCVTGRKGEREGERVCVSVFVSG